MTNSRVSFLAVLGFSLLVRPQMAFAVSDSCKRQEKDLDHWVNGIKQRQSDEFKQCALANGSDSSVCQDLRASNESELRGARGQRSLQMSGCRSRGSYTSSLSTDTTAYHPFPVYEPCGINAAIGCQDVVSRPHIHHHHHHRKDGEGSGDRQANASSGSGSKTNNSGNGGQNTSGSSAHNSGNHGSGKGTGQGSGGGSYTPPA